MATKRPYARVTHENINCNGELHCDICGATFKSKILIRGLKVDQSHVITELRKRAGYLGWRQAEAGCDIYDLCAKCAMGGKAE